jgi:hypothetical protein
VVEDYLPTAWSFPWHSKFPDVLYVAGEDLMGNEVYVYIGNDPDDPRSYYG